MAAKINYYEVLGVAPSATAEEIKKSMLKLSHMYHPDKCDDPNATAIMMGINEAYAVLKDPEKRLQHDKELGVISGVGYANRGPIKTAATLAKVGAASAASVTISFEESFTGCKKAVTYQTDVRCPVCGGTAYSLGAFGNKIMCHRCSGRGVISTSASRDIDIPDGTRAGDIITVRGAGGQAASEGNRNGDLNVTVNVEPSNVFRRSEDDLITSVTIPLEIAMKGGYVSVDNITTVRKIEVKPSPKVTRKMKLAGAGFRGKNGQRGNLCVDVTVELPVLRTDAQKQAFEKFLATLANDDMGKLNLE